MNAWVDETVVRFYLGNDAEITGSVSSVTSSCEGTLVKFDKPVESLSYEDIRDLVRACKVSIKAYKAADFVEQIEDS